MTNPWPDKHVDLFIDLWNQGLSQSQLSDAMARETGTAYSRNSCAGQIGRLRALGRLPPAQIKVKKRRPRARIAVVPDSPPIATKATKAVVAPSAPSESSEPPASLDVSIYDLDDTHCRYPYGERPPYRYCGNPKWADSSYCWHHTRVVRGIR